MPRQLGPSPGEWDPATVKLTLQPHFSGAETETELIEINKLHKWRYAAGDIGIKTKEQAAQAHSHARTRVWDLEMVKRARAIDKDDRTDEQKADIQKVEHSRAYKKSRKGNSGRPPMIPPPKEWRPDLVGEERTGDAWRYAVELNDDESAKTADAHAQARASIIRKFRLKEANDKDPCDRTPEDDAVIAADDVHKAKKKKWIKAWKKEKQKAQQDDNKAKIKNCLVKRGYILRNSERVRNVKKTSRKWWRKSLETTLDLLIPEEKRRRKIG